MTEDVIKQVKMALAKTLRLTSLDNISNDAKLKEDLGLDSMSSLTFLMALEECIEGFIVDAETLEAEHLLSVLTISQYIQKCLHGEYHHG